MKKITILLVALLIFFMPLQKLFLDNADAAIFSKVGTLTAKKIAKEVIQDAAFNQAANMAVLEAIEIAGKYEQKAGFKIVCANGAATCDKPVQVKTDLTPTDKANIKTQTMLELDKLINGGVQFTKWQKFLDWFFPIWLIGFATVAITYALDPDVRSLFNETGYNALVALGLIAPVKENTRTDLEDMPVTPEDLQDFSEIALTPTVQIVTAGSDLPFMELSAPTQFMSDLVTVNIEQTSGFVDGYQLMKSTSGYSSFGYATDRIYVGTSQLSYDYMTTPITTIFELNGTTIYTGGIQTTASNHYVSTATVPALQPFINGKITNIKYSSPYILDGKYRTDAVYTNANNDVLKTQTSSATSNTNKPTSALKVVSHGTTGTTSKVTTVHYPNITPYKKIMLPTYDEVEVQGYDAMETSTYGDGNGNIALIPPSAIPLIEETTGDRVRRVPADNPDGYEFVKDDGTIVPEENVTTGDDPNVTKDPQGVPQVTPQPTPTNPTPEPIPLTPSQPTPEEPPTETPIKTPVETEPPVFPEGESCSEGLKFPKFKQLGSTVANGFPFSLPFDLYDGFQNVFSDIGTEKPEFEYKFKFMGDEQVWKIALPDYFDSWKRFTDILLVVLFDITLLYLFNRFFGAMGSD